MRIRQALVLNSFKDSFHKRWNTHTATRIDEPMVIFGCFHQNQVDCIARHKAMVVVVWVGSDSLYLRNNTYGVDYSKIIRAPHVKHVAISKWIIDDLSALGIPHIYLPITHVDFEQFKLAPLGDSVYCYCPATRPKIYGRKILDAVIERLPDIQFMVTNDYKDVPHHLMEQTYRNAFIGLRLTSHDGQPTTVAEMGLMGRKVIHNGLAPNCIPWRNVVDIVDAIKREQEFIGWEHLTVAKKVRKFLDIGEDWLETEFYEQSVLQRVAQ